MKLSIITNGNLKLGYGHISRTLILADLFKKKGHDVQFIVEEDCSFDDRVINKGFSVQKKQFKNSKEVLDQLKFFNTNCVLIDCVEMEYELLAYLKNQSFYLVSITLFNFNVEKRFENLSFFPSMSTTEIWENGDLKIYSGKEYLIFNENFAQYSEKKFKFNSEKVLISMGGSDPQNITWKVFNALKKTQKYYFTILLSEQNNYYTEIEKEVKELMNFEIISFSNEMPKLLYGSDIVVLNGGTTRYETCLTKTPFVALAIHEVQFEITKQLTDFGVGLNLGIYNQLSESQISNAVIQLLENNQERFEMYKNMERLFDCKGAERMYNVILQNLN